MIIGGIIPNKQVRDIQASGDAFRDGRESAIIADLPSGDYTAITRISDARVKRGPTRKLT